MSDWIVKLAFSSPLRIGREEIDLEGLADGLHSDTLFSALCHAWAELLGQERLEQFLSDYRQKPGFYLSSAFPFCHEHLFLPRPFLKVPLAQDQTAEAKEWKKIAWISPTTLQRWLQAETIDLQQLQRENDLAAHSFQEYTLPRVALDRLTAASNIYFCSQIVFPADCGLYFIVRLEEQNWLPFLRAGLEYLGDCGLGSERNNGYGRFQPLWQNPPQILANLLHQQGEYHYLLSLFHPAPPLPSLVSARYGLIERRGYFLSASTGAQFKRRSVWMLQEGSILPFAPIGQLVDVTPSICPANHHRIYRYGLPLTIPFSR